MCMYIATGQARIGEVILRAKSTNLSSTILSGTLGGRQFPLAGALLVLIVTSRVDAWAVAHHARASNGRVNVLLM
jgi:hypothetical protein